MEQELEQLRKQLNGKLVTYMPNWMGRKLPCEAIFIAPPGGASVSLKPYGKPPTPVELSLAYCLYGEKYCYANIPLNHKNIETLRWLAGIEDGGELRAEKDPGYSPSIEDPRCPY